MLADILRAAADLPAPRESEKRNEAALALA
jgi:hypothetical protein